MVEGIFFNRFKIEKLDLNCADFTKMSKILLLCVDNYKNVNYSDLKRFSRSSQFSSLSFLV